jgi:hypothetical protein
VHRHPRVQAGSDSRWMLGYNDCLAALSHPQFCWKLQVPGNHKILPLVGHLLAHRGGSGQGYVEPMLTYRLKWLLAGAE